MWFFFFNFNCYRVMSYDYDYCCFCSFILTCEDGLRYRPSLSHDNVLSNYVKSKCMDWIPPPQKSHLMFDFYYVSYLFTE